MLSFRRSCCASILLMLAHSSPTLGCADNQNCGPAASPVRKIYDLCSALPFLSPGNDSRVNFWLLSDDSRAIPLDARNSEAVTPPADLWPVPFSYAVLLSAALPAPTQTPSDSGASSSFARGEGTRCVSEARGRAEFEAAVNAAPLPPEEKSALTSLRATLSGECGSAETRQKESNATVAPIQSRLGLEFRLYIAAAAAFYAGRFDEALQQFETLSKSGDAWLKESASYMIARTLLNKAQVGAFGLDGGDDTPKVKDLDSVKAAEKAFEAYMAAYPKGRYFASARGLMRRVYWLEGDTARLVKEYGRLAEESGADAAARFDVAEEIDRKMLIPGLGATHDPTLLATIDLMRMRSPRDKNTLSAAELQAQEPDFSAAAALYRYLKAARAFFVDDDARATLELLGPPAAGATQSNLDFSGEILRALALAASGDKAAEAAWKNLVAGARRPWRRETAELGLAWFWERAQTVNKAFMADSPVRSTSIREILLRNIAGPILLRQQSDDGNASPRERAVARFTLLYKDATHGHYSGFLKDFDAAEPVLDDRTSYFVNARGLNVFRWQGQSAPFVCSSLKAVMAKLATASKDAHALLCLGEFLRTQGFDSFELDQQPAADQLGGQKSIFPGAPFSRGEVYKALIADPSTPEDARAYAYYRAIRCYEPSGVNGCGGADVEKSVRKGWFDALKRSYDHLGYVKALRYYW